MLVNLEGLENSNTMEPQMAIYTDQETISNFTKDLPGKIYPFDRTLAQLIYEKGYPDYTEEIGMYLTQLHLALGRKEKVILLSLPVHQKYFLFSFENGRFIKFREADFLILLLLSLKNSEGFGQVNGFKALYSDYFSPAINQFKKKHHIEAHATIPDAVLLKIETQEAAQQYYRVIGINHEGQIFMARNQQILSFTSSLKDIIVLLSGILSEKKPLGQLLEENYLELGYYHDELLKFRFKGDDFQKAIENLFEINETALDWDKHQISCISNYYMGTTIQLPNGQDTQEKSLTEIPHLQIQFKDGCKAEVNSDFSFRHLSIYLSGPMKLSDSDKGKALGLIRQHSQDYIQKLKNALFDLEDIAV